MRSGVVHFGCPPVGTARQQAVRGAIEQWVRSPTLLQLIQAFDATPPDDADLAALVAWLLEFSERWDFRRMQREAKTKDTGESARWLLDDSGLIEERRGLVGEAATTLGLVGL